MSRAISIAQQPSWRSYKMYDSAHLDSRSVPAMLRGHGNGLEHQWRRFAEQSHEADVEIIDIKFRQHMERKFRRNRKFKLGLKRLFWMLMGGLIALFLCHNPSSTIRHSTGNYQAMPHAMLRLYVSQARGNHLNLKLSNHYASSNIHQDIICTGCQRRIR
jgi:hypothetical protein